jgi:hypothetical protein
MKVKYKLFSVLIKTIVDKDLLKNVTVGQKNNQY